jgi:cytochrome c oxidase subunit 2
VAVLLAGCGTRTNTLEPEGPPSKSIASLWWWLLGSCGFAMLFVCALLVGAWVWRRRSMGPGREPAERAGWIVILTLGVGVMVAGMAALFVVADVFTIRGTEEPAAAHTALTVHAVGHQWYWAFDYPASHVVTADEMHIPVRTPVLLEATTVDVIHSFWVPELNRKVDTIPGQTNAIELYADKVGSYVGVCNQYCGLQHAHMHFIVFADPPAVFRRWLANQKRPARAPATSLEREGEGVFLQGECSSCHRIAGTSAHGTVGPDLTHLATRTTIAGASVPNRPADVTRWITSSQNVQPGNQMPDVKLTSAKLRALVAYLGSLK